MQPKAGCLRKQNEFAFIIAQFRPERALPHIDLLHRAAVHVGPAMPLANADGDRNAVGARGNGGLRAA